MPCGKILKVIILLTIATEWLGLIGFAPPLPIAITICDTSAQAVKLADTLRGIPIWA